MARGREETDGGLTALKRLGRTKEVEKEGWEGFVDNWN